jgi:Leucine-rich repeat (LRR) protein
MKTLNLALLLLAMAYSSNAQNVNIPDTAFLYALIDESVDTNGDSLISYAEAEAVTYLEFSYKIISDMTGIEAFINLDTLDCYHNQ